MCRRDGDPDDVTHLCMCRRDSEPNDVLPLDAGGNHVKFSRPVDGLKKGLSLRIVALPNINHIGYSAFVRYLQ